jgi:hypothetical protein
MKLLRSAHNGSNEGDLPENMGAYLVRAEFLMQLAVMIVSEMMEEMKQIEPDFEKWLVEFEEHISTCFSVQPDPGGHSRDLERWEKSR